MQVGLGFACHINIGPFTIAHLPVEVEIQKNEYLLSFQL
jgi:hypothetical protein